MEVTLLFFFPGKPSPGLSLSRASPFPLEGPVFMSGESGEGTAFRSDALPGPADGGLLREVTDCLWFGVGQRDDVIILAPILVHGGVEDAAGGGAGCDPGVVQPGDRGSCADNSGVVALHELFIHLLVPLQVTKETGRSREWRRCTCVVFAFPASQAFSRGPGIS